ncbi:unnamed protein product [Tilletia controversa]|nr:unnamed protein product [Tilletia controversa]
MKLFTTTLLTLFLGLSALSSAKNSDSARSASLRHRAAIEHQERATLPEARFGLNRNKPIRGVNLGSWLITESWMMPKFYHDAQTSDQPLVDELSWIKAHSNRNDAYEKLKSHYTTYLTEADFQLMQSYGLNSVRVPIPYWTLEDAASSPDEAYLFKGGRPQMRQMLLWCKKYNLDVLLVLHAAPGSQNAYDNSGSRKGVFWQTKQSYYDRTITALETMTDFYVNNASYGGVVKAIIVMNEPLTTAFKPLDKLTYNQHITRTCESGKDLAAVQAVLPVVIGEMSDGVQLRCVDYRDCVGRTMQQDIDTLNSKASNYFARRFWEAQRVVYEQQAGGWFFVMELEVDQCVPMVLPRLGPAGLVAFQPQRASYRDSVQQVWLPSNPNERVFVPNTTEKADGQCVSRKSNHGINFRTGTS